MCLLVANDAAEHKSFRVPSDQACPEPSPRFECEVAAYPPEYRSNEAPLNSRMNPMFASNIR